MEPKLDKTPNDAETAESTSGSPRVDAFPGGFPTAVPTKPAVYQRWAETDVPQMGW